MYFGKVIFYPFKIFLIIMIFLKRNILFPSKCSPENVENGIGRMFILISIYLFKSFAWKILKILCIHRHSKCWLSVRIGIEAKWNLFNKAQISMQVDDDRKKEQNCEKEHFDTQTTK